MPVSNKASHLYAIYGSSMIHLSNLFPYGPNKQSRHARQWIAQDSMLHAEYAREIQPCITIYTMIVASEHSITCGPISPGSLPRSGSATSC